jgi:hypothetical protein
MDDFDWDYALNATADFVDELMSFNVVIMSNQEPDIQIVELVYDAELGPLLDQELGSGYIQNIINNMNSTTNQRCPFFRICMKDFGDASPVNFKLKSFYHKIGMSSMNPRCSKAIVIGLATLSHLDSPINIPYHFCATMIDNIDLDLREEYDMSCLNLCAEKLHPPGSTLCDIAGLTIPCHLAPEIQQHILQYCSSPTADMIRDKMTDIKRSWDEKLFIMFQQREPRIPVHIASTYNAATVQNTAVVATRPFLAPVVPGSGTVYRVRRSS